MGFFDEHDDLLSFGGMNIGGGQEENHSDWPKTLPSRFYCTGDRANPTILTNTLYLSIRAMILTVNCKKEKEYVA